MIRSTEEENGKMTTQELRDNISIFFLAGHDTTSSAISFVLYFLAKYPEIQKKARQHVLDIVGKGVSVPNYEQQKKMDYITMIIKETMRLYPSVAEIIERKLTQNLQLGDECLPAGSYITVSIYNLHHNPKYWKDPEAFNPDRFSQTNSDKRPFFSWNPFGGGARACIGMEFSLIEQRIVIASLLLKYDIILPEGQEIRLKPFGLLAPEGLKLLFKPIA